jgi:hypothetical protein
MLSNLNFLRKQVEFVLLQDPSANLKLSSSAAISRLNVAIVRLSAATLSPKEQERRRALDMAVSANHRAVYLAITLYTDRQTDCCHYRQSLYAGIRGDNPPDIGRVRFNCASFCTVGWFESSVAALFLSVR